MFTSIFKKTTPFSYSLVALFLLVCFTFSVVFSEKTIFILNPIAQDAIAFLLLFASTFVVNFIAKRNMLTKDSAYAILFYFLLHLLFPKILFDIQILLSNFFILLAIRRLISLQSLHGTKHKIFDATFWILVASLFHFWTILFILLVFISIIFHVSRDYRNWLVPVFAAIAFGNLFLFANLVLHQNWINEYVSRATVSYSIDYFENDYQNIAFSIYAVLVFVFFLSSFFSVTSKPINLQTSHKKLILSFLISIAIFVLSANKSNNLLVFTFFPLAIMATNFIEYSQNKINQELTITLFLLLSLFCFITQL